MLDATKPVGDGVLRLSEQGRDDGSPSSTRVKIQKWKWYEYVVLGLWYALLIAWLLFFFSLA